MKKYDSIPLKPVKARKGFICYHCNSEIKPGEIYYMQKDKFLQTLSGKRFCINCYNKYGQKLLNVKKQKINKNQKTLL